MLSISPVFDETSLIDLLLIFIIRLIDSVYLDIAKSGFC